MNGIILIKKKISVATKTAAMITRSVRNIFPLYPFVCAIDIFSASVA